MTTLHPEWMDWPETRRLIEAFNASGAPFRFVGGCVRDALLGRQANDIDIATPLKPDMMETLLSDADIMALPTGIGHGTLTAVVGKKRFEITTLRKDVDCDGRHAEIEYTSDWQEDAARRDFTMNAMFLSSEGALFDYFGGETDANEGRVRFIGDPRQRIREDYLRILRFFRFHAWYGNGVPDRAAVSACVSHSSDIAMLSGERVQHEMIKLLAAPKPDGTLKYMQDGILTFTFGFQVTSLESLTRLQQIEEKTGVVPAPYVRLALLLLKADVASKDAAETLTKNWKLSNELSKRLKLLLTGMPRMQPSLGIAAQKRLLRKLGCEAFKSLVLLRWAMESDPDTTRAFPSMLKLPDEWIPPKFPVSGNELLGLGISEGKAMGELLERLEELWERSDYKMEKEDLLKKAQL